MTDDEYHEWSAKAATVSKVLVILAPRILHRLLVGFLYRLPFDFADRTKHGIVFIELTEQWLPHRQAARRPDVFFIASEHLGRLGKNRFEGPADSVVQVVSDDGVTRYRLDKGQEYEAPSVPEYLVVDGHSEREWVG